MKFTEFHELLRHLFCVKRCTLELRFKMTPQQETVLATYKSNLSARSFHILGWKGAVGVWVGGNLSKSENMEKCCLGHHNIWQYIPHHLVSQGEKTHLYDSIMMRTAHLSMSHVFMDVPTPFWTYPPLDMLIPLWTYRDIPPTRYTPLPDTHSQKDPGTKDTSGKDIQSQTIR